MKPACENCGAKGPGADGLCKPCRIEKHEGAEAKRKYLSELGRKGAKTANARRKKGLDIGELPPLRHPRDAEVWAEAVARAVGNGRLKASAGNTVLRALKSWMEARGAGDMAERLEAFERAFLEWRETGDPEPVLEVIEGAANG